MSNERRLVYSTDPKDQRCPKCGWFLKECQCSSRRDESADKSYTVVFRLEKSGRGGKTVTVMEGWPRNENFLRDMTKDLKSKCGTGGTYVLEPKVAIEIQGDKRDALKKILIAKGIPFKGM